VHGKNDDVDGAVDHHTICWVTGSRCDGVICARRDVDGAVDHHTICWVTKPDATAWCMVISGSQLVGWRQWGGSKSVKNLLGSVATLEVQPMATIMAKDRNVELLRCSLSNTNKSYFGWSLKNYLWADQHIFSEFNIIIFKSALSDWTLANGLANFESANDPF
jgi:hypothetical protein